MASLNSGVDMASINAWQSVQSLGINSQTKLGLASDNLMKTLGLASVKSNTTLGLASLNSVNFQTAVSGAEFAASTYAHMQSTNDLYSYLNNVQNSNTTLQLNTNKTLENIANYKTYQQGVP